jgi:hypothetical protein
VVEIEDAAFADIDVEAYVLLAPVFCKLEAVAMIEGGKGEKRKAYFIICCCAPPIDGWLPLPGARFKQHIL